MNEGSTSARLGLPLLAPGQAQKEITHNEALAMLDIVAGGGVEAVGIDIPPVDPALGKAWIVGAAPIGGWAGRAHALAGWTAGGWRFVAARTGMTMWSVADSVAVRFLDGGWSIGDDRVRRVVIAGLPVVGPRRPAISVPDGGTVVDIQARAAISNVLMTLRGHGLIAT